MNEAKKYKLHYLIEKINEVDNMIKVHSSNHTKFMIDQYKAKKEKLLRYLINELVDAQIRLPYSFRLIMLAISKYYPNLNKLELKSKSEDIRYNGLRYLEAILV